MLCIWMLTLGSTPAANRPGIFPSSASLQTSSQCQNRSRKHSSKRWKATGKLEAALPESSRAHKLNSDSETFLAVMADCRLGYMPSLEKGCKFCHRSPSKWAPIQIWVGWPGNECWFYSFPRLKKLDISGRYRVFYTGRRDSIPCRSALVPIISQSGSSHFSSYWTSGGSPEILFYPQRSS